MLRLVVAALSLALIAGGAWAGFQEARPFVSGGVLARERFDALVDGRLRPAFSINSQNLVLESCLDAALSVYARLQTAERRLALETTCRDIAAGIGQENPTQSYAWFVAAFMSARLDDVTGINTYLQRSQATGSSEQWIAEQRVALAEQVYGELAPETIAAHENDLRLLATSPRGARSIARRYVNDEDFRERITAIVEQMDPSVQRRFLSSVRSAAGAAQQ